MSSYYPPEGPVPRDTFLHVFNDILSNIDRNDIPKDENGGWESWLQNQFAHALLDKQIDQAPYLQGFKIVRDYGIRGNGTTTTTTTTTTTGILIEAEDPTEESSVVVSLCRAESESSSYFRTRLNSTSQTLRESLNSAGLSRATTTTNSSHQLNQNLVIFLVALTHNANDRNKSMAWFFIRQPGIYLMWKPIWPGSPED
ncbi:hypothetical protein BGZ63DRAFT_57516 [Mariannaea sp. PMI_226]|nr:hypothetical protein BGZ63DRAFT_57516 [Mariannaea sp. PMI_226]